MWPSWMFIGTSVDVASAKAIHSITDSQLDLKGDKEESLELTYSICRCSCQVRKRRINH